MSFCEFLALLLWMAYSMVVLSPVLFAVGVLLGWLLSWRGWEVSQWILFWCVVGFSLAWFACLTWATQPPFDKMDARPFLACICLALALIAYIARIYGAHCVARGGAGRRGTRDSRRNGL